MPVETETLQTLFRRETPALYRCALRVLGTREEAEDAVQDAYLRVAHPAVPHAMPDHPRGWLFRVVRNLCIDRVRTRSAHRRIVSDTADVDERLNGSTDGRTPESDLLTSDALDRVARAMADLPVELSEPLSLVVMEGLGYRDVSRILDIPVGTVRSRLNRARKQLRSMLDTDTPRVVPLKTRGRHD